MKKVGVLGCGLMGSGIAQWVSARRWVERAIDVRLHRIARGNNVVGDHGQDYKREADGADPTNHCDLARGSAIPQRTSDRSPPTATSMAMQEKRCVDVLMSGVEPALSY